VSEVKQRLNLDTALAAWPASERPASEWESQAERIEARIASVAVDAAARQDAAGGPSDILGAPTPATPEEVQDSAAPSGGGARSSSRPGIAPSGVENKMQPTERERDRKNLQDLARLASAPSLTPLAPKVAPVPSVAQSAQSAQSARPVEAKLGDSGIVDLKMMAKVDPKAEERAKTTPLATAELFDDDGRPSLAPAPRSGPVAVQAVAAPKVAPAEKKGGPWFAVGGATTILAIAAAAVLMLRSSQQAPVRETVAVSPPTAAAALPTVETKPEAKPEATNPEAVAEAKNPAPPSASAPAADIDITKLPLAENTKPMQKVYGVPQKSGKPSAEKAIDPKLIANNLPPSPNQNGTLNDALKQASGNKDDSNSAPSTPAATGPAFAAGSVPQKPSQGAVTGALGAVMPTVRACLQPDDPISRASVVFDSTGTVTGISVTGAAAGKPAEACIKSALSKAKVQPFAQPTYTANVTIRPN